MNRSSYTQRAGMTDEEAIANYREKRNEWLRLTALEDAAFARYFDKRMRGERTNGAAMQRIGNRASYASADMSGAQSELFRRELDPWDYDDADGVERTPV